MISLYNKADEKMNLTAISSLGYLYEVGKGVRSYIPIAFKYYRKAAKFNKSSALFNLEFLKWRLHNGQINKKYLHYKKRHYRFKKYI